MAEQGLPWYLFGAQAAIVWGSPRLSADVEITAAIEPANVDSFIETMRRHGFDLTFSDPDFLERSRVLLFVHRRTHMPLDVVLAGPGLEEEFQRRAISVDVDGTHIPVISPEDLVIAKILAGRPKDIEDVRSVVHERRASLDGERIRTILRDLEQALGQGDLLPVFEKAWVEQKSPLKKARRRGKSELNIARKVTVATSAMEREKATFFDLADRLARTSDPTEQKRLKESLALMTFGKP